MKLFFLLFIIFQLLNHCAKGQKPSMIKGFIVESKFPDFDTINGQWDVRKYDPLYTRVYFFKDQIIIQPSFIFRNIVAVNDVIVKQDPEVIRYNSFIFSKNSSLGLFCDSNNLQTARLVNKDSFLTTTWIFKDGLKDLFESTDHQLTSSKMESNGDLVEEYFVVSKMDTTMKGVCKLRLTKKDEGKVYYQMSPLIENKKNMKLVEYTIVINARSFGVGKMPMNSFELPSKLSELKIENEEEIIRMFDFANSKLK